MVRWSEVSSVGTRVPSSPTVPACSGCLPKHRPRGASGLPRGFSSWGFDELVLTRPLGAGLGLHQVPDGGVATVTSIRPVRAPC